MEFIERLHFVLEEARNDAKESLVDFLNSKIFNMGRFIRIFSELLVSLKIDLYDDLQISDDQSELKNKLDDFLIKWDEFLKEIEEKSSNEMIQETLQIGNILNVDGDYKKITTNSIESINLGKFLKEFPHKKMIFVLLRHFA